MDELKIIRIMKIKTKKRIVLPRETIEYLKVDDGDFIAFAKDKAPGIRVVKVKLDLKDEKST